MKTPQAITESAKLSKGSLSAGLKFVQDALETLDKAERQGADPNKSAQIHGILDEWGSRLACAIDILNGGAFSVLGQDGELLVKYRGRNEG